MEVDTEASDPHNIALTYLRMEKDVKQLILDTVREEITTNPSGQFAVTIKAMIQSDAKSLVRPVLSDLRLSFRGETTW